MKLFLLLVLILWLTVFSIASQSENTVDSEHKLNALLNQKNTDRLLLVTFSDNTISSIKDSASATSYGERGDAYQSSTWSRRVADQIAEDYGLVKLTEWPMTELNAQCVVYQVEDKASLVDVIERLSKDHRIEIVQKMNAFKMKAYYSKRSLS